MSLRDETIASTDIITHAELAHAWNNYITDPSINGKIECMPMDSAYKIITPSLWSRVLSETTIDADVYLAEYYDCDDFALGLKYTVSRSYGINSIGMVIDTLYQHVYCATIVRNENNELTFKFIEPQTDEIISFPERTGQLNQILGVSIW